MSDVEDELVLRGGEGAMEGDRELNHAEIGADMAAVSGRHCDQFFAYFLRQNRELGSGQSFDVGRTLDGREKTRRRGSGGVVHQRMQRQGGVIRPRWWFQIW